MFPFIKFSGVDIVLGPEMRSTGEVMGVSERFSMAFAKSQLAAGTVLPREGNIFISVADRHKAARSSIWRGGWSDLGFSLLATERHGRARWKRPASPCGASRSSTKASRTCSITLPIARWRWSMNTPSGKGARTDEGKIRAAAVQAGVPCVTTLEAATAAVKAIEALREEEMQVQALQERFAQSI